MAFSIKRISAIDFNPAKAVGINYPFSGPAVFLSNFYTRDAIKSSLIDFFSTSTGERCLNLQYGSGLRNFLFEQTTDVTLADIEALLVEEIENNFPLVRIREVSLTGTPDENSINIAISYEVLQTNISDTVDITIE